MKNFVLFLFILLCPSLAFAHGSQEVGGFMGGLMHPVLGLDHLLAMVSVGIVSVQLGGRAIWSVPLTFVLVMAFGGLVGMYNIDLFGYVGGIILVEQGIMISVMLLGLTIALNKNIPVILAMFATGIFAFFHGFAHGMEIPDIALSLTYIAGFMCSTAFLHICGVGIGLISERIPHGATILRYTGAVILGIGLHMEYLTIGVQFGFL